MRPIAPVDIGEHTANQVDSRKPRLALADPASLMVDESYQRELSQKSLKLIRKIVTGWDWSAFKPPVVVEEAEGYHVIDGQHTAIGALMHPEIKDIPVLVVQPGDVASRAMSFVKHNRDRIAVTRIQEWRALVAAGDELAVEIARACERNGVEIVTPRLDPTKHQTYALGVIADILKRRHPVGLGRVMRCVLEFDVAPMKADHLKAVDRLLYDQEYKGDIGETAIIDLMKRKGVELENDARRFAAERRMPFWKALSSTIFIASRKRNAA